MSFWKSLFNEETPKPPTEREIRARERAARTRSGYYHIAYKPEGFADLSTDAVYEALLDEVDDLNPNTGFVRVRQLIDLLEERHKLNEIEQRTRNIPVPGKHGGNSGSPPAAQYFDRENHGGRKNKGRHRDNRDHEKNSNHQQGGNQQQRQAQPANEPNGFQVVK